MSYRELNMDGIAFVGPEAVVSAPSRGCTSSSKWSHVRPLIKHLYADENHTLKDVMAIMARDHGHRGTSKMYKNRIKKWGLDKKTKEAEAMAILRMKRQRDAVGKDSAFRVRGKTMTMDEVLRYFKRKGILNPEAEIQPRQASTPPAIECWTPLASPTMGFANIQASTEDNIEIGTNLQEFGNAEMGVRLFSMALDSWPSSDDMQAYLSIEQIRNILFSSPEISSFEVPRSPLPPQSLVVSEKLFASIKAFYAGAFDGGLFATDAAGDFVNVNESIVDNCMMEFHDLCHVGVARMNASLFFEGRRCFSKASGLIVRLLREQNPRTVDVFLQTLLCLRKQGYHEIQDILRNLAGDVATVFFRKRTSLETDVLPDQSTRRSHFELAIVQAGRCICETFGNMLGQFHLTSLSCYLDYLSNTQKDSTELLRNLLIEGEQKLEQRDINLLNIKLTYAYSLCDQRSPLHSKSVLEEVLDCCQEIEKFAEIAINSLMILSTCEFEMGDEYQAESRIREAMRRNDANYGKSDSMGLRFRQRLEGWLCEWGREDESAALKAEIEDILGPDDIELEGVNFEEFR